MLHCFSHVQLCVTLWTVARQAPLSMGFSRQEYCSELPRPPQGDLPDPGTEPVSVVSPALAGGFFTMRNTFQIYPWLSLFCLYCFNDVLSSNDFQFVSLIHSAICNDSWIQICPHCSEHKECILGTSLVVQWLGLCAFTAEGQGSTSGRGIKILQALWWSQKKKKKNAFFILAYKALHVYLVLHPSTSFMTQFPGFPRDTGFPNGSDSKESACNAGDAGDMGWIPGLGRSLGVGNGNSLQYSCLENPMDRGAWWTIIHRVAKCQTRLNTHTRDTCSLLGLCTCSSPWPTFPSDPVTQLEKKLA